MSGKLLIEQFHLNVYVPHALPAPPTNALRHTLAGATFRARLRRAAAAVFRRERSLRAVTVRLSR